MREYSETVFKATGGKKIAPNIFRYTLGGEKSGHPATFPERLAYDQIATWSNEGDLIYDPFMGSGTTAKMAHIYKRNWIGSEISEEYCKIIERRIDSLG